MLDQPLLLKTLTLESTLYAQIWQYKSISNDLLSVTDQ
jgi:hypothetical protein